MGVAVIMAGGFGKRLWPESNINHPKQFLAIKNKESFIQATYRRASQLVGAENTYLILREELKDKVLSHIPSLSPSQLITEPVGRDTAPCIGFSATWIKKKKGDVPIVVLPSDHLIEEEDKFNKVMSAAIKQAEKEYLIAIGIKPTRAETGYGYLQLGEKIGEISGTFFYKLKRFTEKPSQKKAKEFFESGNFLWNAGIFVWRPSIILEEIKKYLPQLYEGLEKIQKFLDTPEEEKVKREIYPNLPKISIDYAVMEKTDKAIAVPGDFFWDDIGDWQALERIFSKDKQGNIMKGLVKGIESVGSTFINRENKILGVIGLSNIIVINCDKGLLIVKKELSQKVKDLVNAILEDENLKKYLE